ncbi:molybdate ABC transporter ATP-binding protein ModF [Photobacterium sanctipauli]|uniref:Molybdate ABC transporter ATP-binding protein ModF n=1 Tax=Photobacterium sanctipauli TaxID=1342794 RepID=A0A2T3P0H2_9GAMM|nr:molybdate ABC transporter ATP-binding protein ModF [Photobacterium sanctipauli]PSW22026.1 molybdate ABC transporter ATP-binding protein ModF [Photobacterium sanctipauli]
MSITFTQLHYQSATTDLSIPEWQVQPNQHWAIFSSYGQAGTLLVDLIGGDLEPSSGSIHGLPEKLGVVSLARQQALLEAEIKKDDTDFLDRIDTGSTVEQLVRECCEDAGELEAILQQVDLVALRERGFRMLSTGETRRLMLARALASKPALLVLDEPYAGLDIQHQQDLSALLNKLSTTVLLLLVTSREDELPDCISHIALFDGGKLSQTMSHEKWYHHPVLQQLKAQSAERSEEVLALIRQNRHQAAMPDPLVDLKNGKVEYIDKLIFESVNWQINHGEHWQVRGPNGCGKSTLLGLIFGDHPQCYSNDITIFGMKRGSGETVWDIKQHIGMVSSALHLQYRVSCSALDVVLSGFYDSIGLYQQPSQNEIEQAKAWLAIFHMSELASVSFRQLEYGQQRLLLIARALIKKPVLLILDEPYQGLDFLNRKLVYNALEMVARENLSQLLYVSHHVEDALPSITNFVEFVPLTDEEIDSVAYTVNIKHD